MVESRDEVAACEVPGQCSALFVGPADSSPPSQVMAVKTNDAVVCSCPGGEYGLEKASVTGALGDEQRRVVRGRGRGRAPPGETGSGSLVHDEPAWTRCPGAGRATKHENDESCLGPAVSTDLLIATCAIRPCRRSRHTDGQHQRLRHSVGRKTLAHTRKMNSERKTGQGRAGARSGLAAMQTSPLRATAKVQHLVDGRRWWSVKGLQSSRWPWREKNGSRPAAPNPGLLPLPQSSDPPFAQACPPTLGLPPESSSAPLSVSPVTSCYCPALQSSVLQCSSSLLTALSPRCVPASCTRRSRLQPHQVTKSYLIPIRVSCNFFRLACRLNSASISWPATRVSGRTCGTLM